MECWGTVKITCVLIDFLYSVVSDNEGDEEGLVQGTEAEEETLKEFWTSG